MSKSNKKKSNSIFHHIKQGNVGYVKKNINKFNSASKDPCNFSCLLGNAIYYKQHDIVNVILDENIEYRDDQLFCYDANIIQQAVNYLDDIDTLKRVILRYKDKFDLNGYSKPKEQWYRRYRDHHYKFFPVLFTAIELISPEKVDLLIELGADPLLEFEGKSSIEFAKSDEMQNSLNIYKENGIFTLWGSQLSNNLDYIINILQESIINLWTKTAKQLYECDSSDDSDDLDEFEPNKRQCI